MNIDFFLIFQDFLFPFISKIKKCHFKYQNEIYLKKQIDNEIRINHTSITSVRHSNILLCFNTKKIDLSLLFLFVDDFFITKFIVIKSSSFFR